MPLFVCDKCGVIENTALSLCSWIEFGEKKPMLCSKCCPKQKKWHNKFPRRKWAGKEKVLNRQSHRKT